MANRGGLSAVLAFAAVFGTCRVLCANSLSPYVWFLPGMAAVSLVYAFPASLLVAVLERPFLSAAGIRRRPLALSLQANFVSTLAGILLLPIAFPAIYTIGILWCLVAVGVSCVVEIWYLRRFSHQPFRAAWIVAGNSLSSFALLLVPLVAQAAKQCDPGLVWSLAPYSSPLAIGSLAVSLAVFLASFAWPVGRGAQEAPHRADDSTGANENESPVDVSLAPPRESPVDAAGGC